MAFTVQVYRASRPAKGIRVQFSFKGFGRGMSSIEYTDADGIATFEKKYEKGEIELFADGKSRGDFYYEWGKSVTITI